MMNNQIILVQIILIINHMMRDYKQIYNNIN
jgi:hypothetical protein